MGRDRCRIVVLLAGPWRRSIVPPAPADAFEEPARRETIKGARTTRVAVRSRTRHARWRASRSGLRSSGFRGRSSSASPIGGPSTAAAQSRASRSAMSISICRVRASLILSSAVTSRIVAAFCSRWKWLSRGLRLLPGRRRKRAHRGLQPPARACLRRGDWSLSRIFAPAGRSRRCGLQAPSARAAARGAAPGCDVRLRHRADRPGARVLCRRVSRSSPVQSRCRAQGFKLPEPLFKALDFVRCRNSELGGLPPSAALQVGRGFPELCAQVGRPSHPVFSRCPAPTSAQMEPVCRAQFSERSSSVSLAGRRST